ncbi:MAG: hypothetical protein ABIR28_08880 [Vicinamibacteria bacterium]
MAEAKRYQVRAVERHLALPYVIIEDRDAVERALSQNRCGH